MREKYFHIFNSGSLHISEWIGCQETAGANTRAATQISHNTASPLLILQFNISPNKMGEDPTRSLCHLLSDLYPLQH